MTRPELVAYLNTLELEHDVNSMLLDDACVWPLVRQKIGTFLLRNEEPPGSEDFELRASKARRAFRVVTRLIRNAWSRVALPRTDLLFLSKAAHKQLVQQVRFDRFSDPLVGAAVHDGFTCLVLEHGRASSIDHGDTVCHWDLAPQLEAGAKPDLRSSQCRCFPVSSSEWNGTDMSWIARSSVTSFTPSASTGRCIMGC